MNDMTMKAESRELSFEEITVISGGAEEGIEEITVTAKRIRQDENGGGGGARPGPIANGTVTAGRVGGGIVGGTVGGFAGGAAGTAISPGLGTAAGRSIGAAAGEQVGEVAGEAAGQALSETDFVTDLDNFFALFNSGAQGVFAYVGGFRPFSN